MISIYNEPQYSWHLEMREWMCLCPQGHRQSLWQIHIGIKMVRRMSGIDATSSILYSGRAKKGQNQTSKLFLGDNKALKKTPLPFYSILRMLSESMPQWTQIHRWERFSSKINL
jgi:hypothetical protein